MKKTTGAILFVVILVVFGWGIYYIINYPKPDAQYVAEENVFAKETETNLATPVGVLGSEYITKNVEGEEKHFDTYYYQNFGNTDNQMVFEPESVPGNWSNTLQTKKPYIEKDGDNYNIKIWDQTKNSSEIQYIFPQQQYNFGFQGLALSADGRNLYVAVTFNDKDWNTETDSFSDINTTAELYRINLTTKEAEKLFKKNDGLDYYNIAYATDRYLILIKTMAESDWQQYVVFDIKEKEFVKEFEEGWMVTALSPNGRYFAYNVDLFSKGGEFDPSQIKIVDMDNLETIPTDFLSSYDFGAENQGEVWSNYLELVWGTDNKTLYTVKHNSNNSGYDDAIVYEINLADEKISEVQTIPKVFNSVNLIGVYQDTFILETFTDNKMQIWSFPEQKVLLEVDGYGFSNSQIISVPGEQEIVGLKNSNDIDSLQSDLKLKTSLYMLRDGHLVFVDKGVEKVISEDNYDKLLALSEDGNIWVGKKINETDNGMTPYYELNLSLLDSLTGEVIESHIFEEVESEDYYPISKRFVLNYKTTNDTPEGWTQQITILDSDANIIEEFQEENITDLYNEELSDGTIMMSKKDNDDTIKTYLALKPLGVHEIKTFQIPLNTYDITFFNSIPLTVINNPKYNEMGYSGGEVYRIDTEDPELFWSIDYVQSIHNKFSIGSDNYVLLSQGDYVNNVHSPCGKLFRLNGNMGEELIGSASFAMPGAEGKLIYGQPIDSCQHVRIWETDTDGKNAILLSSYSYQGWYKPSILVTR